MMQTRFVLLKWVVALLVPISVFTFVWSGEAIVNNVLLGLFQPGLAGSDTASLIQAAIFIVIFYSVIITFVGYLVAADSGRRGLLGLWTDVAIFALLPIFMVIVFNDLFIGLAVCAIIWPAYLYVRGRVRKASHYETPPPLDTLKVTNSKQRGMLIERATAGGFWFAALFASVWLIADLIFYFVGQLPLLLLAWVAVRTLILPVAGYFLGRLGGLIALRRTIAEKSNGTNNAAANKSRQLEVLSATRVREEVKDLVPNDLPLQSTGAQRFYILLLFAFLLFYPVLDPFLFGFGTAGRLANYGDAGRYVILALGLNIVVGFAGLLDLGYVAFFAIGAYTWGMVGSQQFTVLTGIVVNPQIWPWFFWPMVLVTALIAAFWGVVLGAPTLRLRGDYLAIVTLGFGEIVPIIFLNMDKYTNGTNGLTGVYSPAFPGIRWTVSTPLPYYYLILVLIAFVLLANVRLRDSRLGRAWIAIREDEVAAASSGVNLVRTKLFAFAAGAFFSGIAGAYYAAKLGGVSPDSFSFSDSVIYLAMVVIGGLGSIPGVIVGALAVYAINVLILSQLDTLATNPSSIIYPINALIVHVFPNFSFGNIRNLIFGIVLIVIMIFRPEGLLPSTRRRRELQRIEAPDEAVEISSLDATPGAPGFESEVHVE
ncbi:MAG: branched-chain amino acid ABC transporter permease [Ktedonobacteraceae bacterium]|nr:branched-chain amino acid ABC transporter permease [Ktedonobacteraceae bacterium]